MKRFNLLMVMALVGLLGMGFKYHPQEKSQQKKETPVTKAMEQQKEIYFCPMHPQVTSDRSGKCPKCGMELVKKEPTESQQKTGVEMDSMCAHMCEMMQKNPAMMKMMHEQMMKEMKGSPSDSTHKGMMQKDMMKSCCGMMKKHE